MCSLANPLACVPDVGEVAEAAAVGGVTAMIDELLAMATEWAVTMLSINATWWVHLPTPAISDCNILERRDGTLQASPTCGEVSGAIEALQGHTAWVAAMVAVFALVFAAIRMALTRDGAEAGQMVKGLFTYVAAVTAGVAVVQLLVLAADAFSSWIILAATDDLAEAITSSFYMESEAMLLGMLVLSGLGGIIGIAQFLMMLSRLAGLVLISGLLPVAAAAAATKGGQAMFVKYTGWLLAFVLYKPVAAVVFACCLWMMDNSTFGTGIYGTFIEALVIITMMVLSLFALPALMRLSTPAVGALAAAGSGAGGVMAMAGSGAAVATGAAELRSRHASRSETTSTSTSQAPSDPGSPSGAATSGATSAKPAATGAASTTGASGATAGGAAAGSTAAGTAGAAAAGAATGGVALGAMVAVEAAKRVHGEVQKHGEVAAGEGPTGADQGGQ
jgi:type IV secretion system protein TrbL